VVLVSEDNRATYIKVTHGRVELSSSSAEVGAAAETVPASYDGDELEVCVNGGYVLDFLSAAASPTVTLALRGKEGTILMTDGANHIGVVMLMRS
jgi:DNA polymerase III sliding clamp (beta) subunit (PCNA family)